MLVLDMARSIDFSILRHKRDVNDRNKIHILDNYVQIGEIQNKINAKNTQIKE